MATWVDKSFALAESGGYLDKLAQIYPAPPPIPQHLANDQYKQIKNTLIQSGDYKLLTTFLSFKRFPFNDPYISFLRESPQAIHSNPQTVKRLCNRLREMGLEGVVRGLIEPKQFNRQMGQMFNKWIHSKYLFTADNTQFQASKEPIIFLSGTGEKLRQFANQLGCGLQKQPDFVVKAKGRYAVGEAKFIGSEGGNQNRGFDDAIALASHSYKNAVTVAILDGIIWIPESGQMARRLKNFSGNALTALLLDDFLNSL